MFLKVKIKYFKFFLFFLLICIIVFFVFFFTKEIKEPTSSLIFQHTNQNFGDKEITTPTTSSVLVKDQNLIILDQKREESTTTVAVEVLPQDIFIEDVPFLVQAPFGEWKDPRQQDACEEAASLIAVSWATGISKISKTETKEKILDIVKYQTENFGEYRDTSAADTLKYIIKGYFNYQKARLEENIKIEDIITELAHGNLVIVPANGQALHNPYFTQPGPERHMLVLRGHDSIKKEFIANDPGIGRGEKYHYPQETLWAAIRDYETGYHVLITGVKKTMIVVEK
ncbi:MAG TPA: C39 family peptidase [bacterium]|nr:C39 family peptidase [bacterium]